MSYASLADRQLLAATAQLTTRRTLARLHAEWSTQTALAGRRPDEVIALVARPADPDSNPVLAALVRLAQAGDHHAVVAALGGLRLGLWGVVHRHCGHRDEAFDELLTHASLALGRIDPSLDRLYDRVIGRARAATKATRLVDHLEIPTELPIPANRSNGRHDPTADAAIARASLSRLEALVTQQCIDAATVAALIETRFIGTPAHRLDDARSPAHLRADTSRLARQLAALLAA